MRTNGAGLAWSAAARRGAERPNTDTPRPPMSATRSLLPDALPYAAAIRDSSAAGSSSEWARDTHPTGRSSIPAHSARSVDLPYPAGAVTPTTRQVLVRAVVMSGARLTDPGCGRGRASLASSSSSSSSTAVGPTRAE